MLAAGGWEILKELRHHSATAGQENWSMLGLGFVVAAAVSFVAVKWLLRYVQTHTFTAFGWYRIAVAIFIAILLIR
jgi:undecaprenyl-diphosphatase